MSFRSIFCIGMFMLALTNIQSEDERASFHQKLAFHWAPIHYQDCAQHHWQADMLTRINFDGDWDTGNNWDNTVKKGVDLRAAVYYSVVETPSHWFILYSFFHPRDWMEPWEIFETEHENDLEGLVVMVAKAGGTGYGQLQAVISVAHLDFYSYIPQGSPVSANKEDIDGKLIWKKDLAGTDRICTFQEAKGHGIYALSTGSDFGSQNDYFVYHPTEESEGTIPASPFDKEARYTLVNLCAPGELWEKRFDGVVFRKYGEFHNNYSSTGNANAPWKWNDWDDDESLKGGELALDPARLFSIYFKVPGLISEYVYNPYIAIE